LYQPNKLSSYNILDNDTNRYLTEVLSRYFKEKTDNVLQSIASTPVPEQTLINLEKIIDNIDKYTFTDDTLIYTIKIASFSPFLTKIIRKNPDYFLSFLFSDKNYQKTPDFQSYIKSLERFCSKVKSVDELKKYIRYFKQREFLRIGFQDILKIVDIKRVTQELSDLAAAFVEYVSVWLSENKFKQINRDEIFILGMGKLSGQELNFSSDIDLIYFYKRNETHDIVIINFFEQLTKIINDITEDGFVFRVDLRLRPEGINGPIAVDFDSGLFYYENFGRFWERAALIKARPIAGNIEMGNYFLKSLNPFIYRRSLDFNVINEIKLLKEKINRSLNSSNFDKNIKLGFGGIREIEFIIQNLQLIFGGKYPEIRVKNSLDFLEIMKNNYQLISVSDIETLTSGYRFLRSLEHKIQILHEQQTHDLPDDSNDLKIISSYFNFDKVDNFLSHQMQVRQDIHKIFIKFFELEIAKSIQKDIHEIFVDLESDKIDTIEQLRKLNFEEPSRIYDSFIYFKSILPSENYKLLIQILSDVLLLIGNFRRKDNIINGFLQLLEKIKFSKGYLNFFIENISVIEIIMNIFEKSDYLASVLTSYKEIFEEIFFTDFLTRYRDSDSTYNDLDKSLARVSSYEDCMEQIRIFKHRETLRVGLPFLNDQLEVDQVITQVTDVADAILNKSLKIVEEEFINRYGFIKENKFAVIALGKFGGRELNFLSDLDIIFLFEKDSYSEKGLRANEYFSRLLQRLISFLSIRTLNGIAYEIDTRLRPSGNAGTLVTSFEAFSHYHNISSSLWEIQALLKARFVAGDYQFGEKVTLFIKNLILNREISQEGIDKILKIRNRIEVEEGQESKECIDIKSGLGGLIDIEFLIQMLQLKHKILTRNTFNAIKIFKDRNLLERDTLDFIDHSYRYLRKLENILRLSEQKSKNKIYLNNLKSGYITTQIDKIIETKRGVRDIFDKLSKNLLKI